MGCQAKAVATMDFEFRSISLTTTHLEALRTVTAKNASFAADVLSGRVKFRECLYDGRVVGHCIGNSATGEILGLSVHHSYRRKGIARKLLSLMVGLLRADGATKIWLAAPADTDATAYQFYNALQWRQVDANPSTGEVIFVPPPDDRGDQA